MKMKLLKRLALLGATVLLCAALAGCEEKPKESGETGSSVVSQQGGSQSGETVAQTDATRVYVKDVNLDDYVTVKDYASFRVAKDPIEVREDDVQTLLDTVYLNSFPETLRVTDRAVEEGDTANINFVGKKDGVAFDGGTADDVNLTIGSGTYIPGFESGLVGVMPGETVDLNLTFPESYGNADLAGQAVIFTVTVNYIIPAEKMDEAVVGIIEEVNTVEELRQYIYDYLYSVADLENEQNYEDKILDTFLNEMCEFKEIPSTWIDYYTKMINDSLVTYTLQYGTDPETYCQSQYGMSFENFLATNSDIATRRELALQVVAKREGYFIEDDAKLQEELNNIATQYGSASADEFLSANQMTFEDFRQDYAYEQALMRIVEIAQQ